MTPTLETVHKDLVSLKKDLAYIKNLVAEDFELSDDAKRALQEAKATPATHRWSVNTGPLCWDPRSRSVAGRLFQGLGIGAIGGIAVLGVPAFPDCGWFLFLFVALIILVLGLLWSRALSD